MNSKDNSDSGDNSTTFLIDHSSENSLFQTSKALIFSRENLKNFEKF